MSTPSITVCRRTLQDVPERHLMVTEAIAAAGCRVVEVRDGPLDLATDDVVLMMANAT